MNTETPNNPINQLQSQIRDGVIQKIETHFQGERLSILLGDIINQHDLIITNVHPETVRALCHYASVLAGEATNTAIFFAPDMRTEWQDNGYSSKEVTIENEFIVVARHTSDFKRKPTHEDLTAYDIKRRESKERYERQNIGTHDHPQAQTPIESPKPRPSRSVPGHVSRLMNNRRGF